MYRNYSHRIYLRQDINNEPWRVFEDQSTETMDYANSEVQSIYTDGYMQNRNDKNVVN
jgi:hypothetical protein